jgi:colanic acid biosynthesis glycosyl transferase WcaI
MSLKVTMLGINFPPEQTGIAPYTGGLASGLASRGWQVKVISTHPHYPQWRVADGHGGWRRRGGHDGVAVERVRHYVPSRPTGVRRAVSEVSFGARATTSSWGSPDAVVCVSPALLSSAMAVMRASASRRVATGLIMQDLYSAGIGETDAGGGRVERALTGTERWVVNRVDGVSVIHSRFKDRVVRSLGVPAENVSVVRNWTHVPATASFDRAANRHSLGWGRSKVVLHAGAMGEKQGLANVVEAAREAERRGSDVLFVLLGDGGQRTRLESQAEGLSRIRFIDPLPGEAYGQAMRSADVLLVNEKPGVVEMAVPSKLTSYFSTGVPVLAATDPRSTTSDEVVASGAGVLAPPGDPAALLDAVERLCADHTAAAAIGARGPAYCASVLSEEAAIDGYETWIHELIERAARRRGER